MSNVENTGSCITINGVPMNHDDDGIPSSQGSDHGSICYDVSFDVEMEDPKVINDAIHGHIELHALLVKFIDTPQFQRLRFIKQLGTSDLVYPGAVHTRFAHCIGTCHLAGKLITHLQRKQPELNITQRDVLCVQLAGLLHDIGHGPYSHLYDGPFLGHFGTKWHHEQSSLLMIDHMIEENSLKPVMEEYGLDFYTDVTFIKEAIFPSGECMVDGKWQLKGRSDEKSFMYEIVSNERNKVDVDKWDYFARDCHHLGIKNGFDHNRFICFTKVLQVKGSNGPGKDSLRQICVRDKMCEDLYEMFNTRSLLHRKAYQHKVTTGADMMLCDALILANNHLLFEGTQGEMKKLSECYNDPTAYEKLTDNIFTDILFNSSDHEDMKKAKSILKRIMTRNLYSFCGEVKLDVDELVNHQKSNLCLEIANESLLSAEDLEINIKKINYGMGTKNPIDQFLFYSKQNRSQPYVIRREDVSTMLPNDFQDRILQVYCKNPSAKELACRQFQTWCVDKKFKFYRNKSHVPNLTPLKRKFDPTENGDKKRMVKRKL